jgi:hypothetical protein
MTQSFAFNPHASQEANEDFVRSLSQAAQQEENTKPIINLRQSSKRRTRTEDGKFIADNPETPEDEAWEK